MKHLQFSLSGLLLITAAAAGAVVFGQQMAPEGVLVALWWGVFLLSYYRLRKARLPSWRRVLTITLITGSVWTRGIVSSYLMYAQVQESRMLAMHGAAVVVVGTTAAAVLAILATLLEFCWQAWHEATVRRRCLLSIGVIVTVAVGSGAWWVRSGQFWHPQVVGEENADLRTSAAIGIDLKQKHDLPDHNSGTLSPDGRLMAVHDGTEIVVFDIASERLLSRLNVPADQRIDSFAFLPDGKELAAVVRKDAESWELLRWPSIDCPVPQSIHLPGGIVEPGEKLYPLLVDHHLLLVRCRRARHVRAGLLRPIAAEAQLRLAVLDLEKEPLRAVEFSRLAEALSLQLRQGLLPLNIKISPGGQWVLGNREINSLVFGPGAEGPREVPGWPLGFCADGRKLALKQERQWPSWHAGQREPMTEPPFWRRVEFRPYFRVLLFDCRDNRVVALSRWWGGTGATMMTRDKRSLVFRNAQRGLVWQMPPHGSQDN